MHIWSSGTGEIRASVSGGGRSNAPSRRPRPRPTRFLALPIGHHPKLRSAVVSSDVLLARARTAGQGPRRDHRRQPMPSAYHAWRPSLGAPAAAGSSGGSAILPVQRHTSPALLRAIVRSSRTTRSACPLAAWLSCSRIEHDQSPIALSQSSIAPVKWSA